MSTNAPALDAVTAVLMHDDAVYIVRRQPHLQAFSGYHAFPGGKVDPQDEDGTPLPAPLASHPPRLMRALARELREELDFDLIAAAENDAVRAIAGLGEATTPPHAPLRFRTHFYRIALCRRPALTPHADEASGGEWVPAAALWQRYLSGRLLLAPPTRAVIERLARDGDVESVPGLAFAFDAQARVPMVEPLHGLRVLPVRSNTIPPADRTNAFWLGGDGAPRVLMDPAPRDRDELERLHDALDELGGVDLVFLTHHHPDHREYADAVARRYGAPIGLSEDSASRIRAKTGGRFFEGLDVRIYGEGDVLTRWLGEDVRLHAVPGHDEGQLAPMPESRAWCIVSDLIQGVGTVVVGGPEGDMAKYFGSLRRVIEMDPDVVIPSHGMALGGTWKLSETLRHRELREQQVLSLHRAGKSAGEIVPAIYAATPKALWPLARLNIESHLAKLRAEGRIS